MFDTKNFQDQPWILLFFLLYENIITFWDIQKLKSKCPFKNSQKCTYRPEMNLRHSMFQNWRRKNALLFKHLHTVVNAILVEDTIALLRPPVGR